MEKRNISKNNGLGSYYWGDFRDNNTELVRLKKQASIGIELERSMWEALEIPKNAFIIDIGCGPGVIASELAKYASDGKVIGIDKNKLMIEECNNNESYKKITNLSFREGDILNLDIEENSVDFIYCRFLFQHLSDPLGAILQMKKILKKGGKMCIIDVDDSWLTLLPRPEYFDSYLVRCEKAQADRGGDRFVGHKLKGYMEEVGLANIFSEVKMVNSDVLGIKDLLDMIINYKYQLVNENNDENVEKERTNILSLGNKEFAWGAVGLFYSVGEK